MAAAELLRVVLGTSAVSKFESLLATINYESTSTIKKGLQTTLLINYIKHLLKRS